MNSSLNQRFVCTVHLHFSNMPAPLSIIIPTLNAEKHLQSCIASLLKGIEPTLVRELFLVDGRSTVRTIEVADAADGVIIETTPNRCKQLMAGDTKAKGSGLLILRVDTVLSNDWHDEVLAHIENSPLKAVTFSLSYNFGAWLSVFLAFCANLRTTWFG